MNPCGCSSWLCASRATNSMPNTMKSWESTMSGGLLGAGAQCANDVRAAASANPGTTA